MYTTVQLLSPESVSVSQLGSQSFDSMFLYINYDTDNREHGGGTRQGEYHSMHIARAVTSTVHRLISGLVSCILRANLFATTHEITRPATCIVTHSKIIDVGSHPRLWQVS